LYLIHTKIRNNPFPWDKVADRNRRMMMQLSYISPIWFVLLQVFTLIDVGAEITLTELSSSFSTNYYDLDSELSGSFTQGEDDVSSDAPRTDMPSSVPGSYLPAPTTLSPTDSEAPTSEVVRIAMRGLAQGTMKPSPQDTTAPTPSLVPTNSFAVSPLLEERRMEQNDTETVSRMTLVPTVSEPDPVDTPTITPVTLAPVVTIEPTESLLPSEAQDDGAQERAQDNGVQDDGATDVGATNDEVTALPPVGENTNEDESTDNSYAGSYGAHSVQIDVTYDDSPEEISWSLMRHPAIVEVEMGFNSTYIQAGKTSTFVVNQLQEGKYYFRMTDSGLNGLGSGGSYRIVDTSGGGFRLIHHSDGDFGWFDYKEFYLGKQRDFYIFGYDRRVETATDRFYTLDKGESRFV